MATTRGEKKAETEVAHPATEPEEIVRSVKGFDKNLRCRDFQFEIGKTYEHDGPVKACASGFHAVTENPFDVFDFYAPAQSRYADVTQSGAFSREGAKLASAKITIKAELTLPKIVERAIAWVIKHATGSGSNHTTGDRSASSATGDRSASSATGYRSASSATGDRSASSATGNQSASSATGDQSASSATGNQSASSATGDQSASSATGYRSASSATGYRSASSAFGPHGAAMSTGYEGRVSGKKGCALFLVYRDPNSNEIIHVWAGIAGRDGIKPNVFYILDKTGKPQEAS